MKMNKHFCGYCGTHHANLCPKAKAGVRRVRNIMAQIEANQAKPGSRDLTSNQMRVRADQLRGFATSTKLQGEKVRSDYE